MLTIWVVLKAVLEIALLALIGRGVLGWMVGPNRARNVFYRALDTVVQPALWVVRTGTLHKVAEPQLPRWAFAILALLWVGVTWAKIRYCLAVGVALCQ